MSETVKYILLFIAVMALTALGFYGVGTYKDIKLAQVELSKQEIVLAHENDSLKTANSIILSEREELLKGIDDNEKQKENNHKYYADKTKRDITKPANEQNKILIDLIEK